MRNLRIIFAAMFLSVAAYALVGTFVGSNLPRPSEDSQQLYKIISFLGGLCVAGLLLIRNLINRALVPAGQDAGATEQGSPSSARILRARKLTLVAFALSEAIALLGLVFVFLGGQRRTLYIFCAISLACLILFFPRDTH